MTADYTENKALAQIVIDIHNIGKEVHEDEEKKYQIAPEVERFYHSQVACKKCGNTKRYTSNKNCVHCAIEKQRTASKKLKEEKYAL